MSVRMGGDENVRKVGELHASLKFIFDLKRFPPFLASALFKRLQEFEEFSKAVRCSKRYFQNFSDLFKTV